MWSPSGQISLPLIQEGHLDVARTHTPNGMDVAAQANITTVAGTNHHMRGAGYLRGVKASGSWPKIRM